VHLWVVFSCRKSTPTKIAVVQIADKPNSIMINQLIPQIGFGWTMRTLAFMLLALLIIANVTVKSRLHHSPKPYKIMDFVVPLKEPRFLLLSMGSFFFFWGLFTPINFIVLYGEYYGMAAGLAGYQVAILNAGRYVEPLFPSASIRAVVPKSISNMY
jgi:hypothetical protein